MTIAALIGLAVGAAGGWAATGFAATMVALQAAMLGATIGATLGMMVDPITGQEIGVGSPDTQEFQITTAAEGVPIPDLIGTSVLVGNIIWYGRNRSEQINDTVTQGGKGGGGGTQTAVSGYRYYLSAAVGLCLGPVSELYEVWQNDIKVWAGNALPDAEGKASIILSEVGPMTFYFGTEDQTPDDYLAEYIDDDTLLTPWKRVCYAVFKDAYIGQYNRWPNFRFVLRKTPLWGLNQDVLRIDTYDHNPIAAAYYLLNERAQLPIAYCNDNAFLLAAATIHGEKLGISGVIKTDVEAIDLCRQIFAHIDGILRYVAATSGYAMFEPVLLRDGGDREDLPIITEDDIIGQLDFQRPSWGATECNELSVTFNERLVAFGGDVDNPDGGHLVLGYGHVDHGIYCVGFRGFSALAQDWVTDVAIISPYTYLRGLIWTGPEMVTSTGWTGEWGEHHCVIWKRMTSEKRANISGIYNADLGFDGMSLYSGGGDVYKHLGLSASYQPAPFIEGTAGHWTLVGITVTKDGDVVVARYHDTGYYQVELHDGYSTTIKETLNYGATEIKALAWVNDDLVVLTDTDVIRHDGFSLDVADNGGPYNTYNGTYGYATAVAWAVGDVKPVAESEDADEGLGIKQSSRFLDDAANKRITGRGKPQTMSCPWFPMERSALWAGRRTLAKAAFPSAAVRFTGNRNLYKYQVGDRFRLYYAPYEIEEMVFRITLLEEADLQEETIQVTAEQAVEYTLSPPAPETPGPEDCTLWTENLCLYGTKTASTENGDHAAGKACDTDIATRWEAASADGAWWQVDFGAGTEYAIEQLRLRVLAGNNMNGSIKNFRIKAQRNAGGAFLSIYDGRQHNSGEWMEHRFRNKTPYRILRLEVIDQWNATYFPGIWEIEMRSCLSYVHDDPDADDERACFYPADATDDGYIMESVLHSNDANNVTGATA